MVFLYLHSTEITYYLLIDLYNNKTGSISMMVEHSNHIMMLHASAKTATRMTYTSTENHICYFNYIILNS